MTHLEELQARADRHVMPTYGPAAASFVRGQGTALFDADGVMAAGSDLPIFGDIVGPVLRDYPIGSMRSGDLYWYSDCYGSRGAVSHSNDQVFLAPVFAGDTIYAWSEVLDKAELSETCGALRLRLVAVKDSDPGAFAYKDASGKYAEGVLLDFDYWAAIPRAR